MKKCYIDQMYEESWNREIIISYNDKFFKDLIQTKNSIPSMLKRECEVFARREWNYLKSWTTPLKSNQTRKRKEICKIYTFVYRKYFSDLETEFRNEITGLENKLFQPFLTIKNAQMLEVERIEKNRKSIIKRNKFCNDILTIVGEFLDPENILNYMRAFNVFKNTFSGFIECYKLCGFINISVRGFQRYIDVQPTNWISSLNVIARYGLLRQDVINEPYERKRQHRRYGPKLEFYNERRVMVLSCNKSYNTFFN